MDWKSYINSLYDLGYFRYVDGTTKSHFLRVLEKLKHTDSLFGIKAKRDYPADEERLAECGVKNFIMLIAPLLRANSVIFRPIKEECSREGYDIYINKRKFTVYSRAELNASNIDLWNLAKKRTFAIINTLLNEAGSNERLYSLYGGNNHWAFFLTKELYDLILKSGLQQEGSDLLLYENVE